VSGGGGVEGKKDLDYRQKIEKSCAVGMGGGGGGFLFSERVPLGGGVGGRNLNLKNPLPGLEERRGIAKGVSPLECSEGQNRKREKIHERGGRIVAVESKGNGKRNPVLVYATILNAERISLAAEDKKMCPR